MIYNIIQNITPPQYTEGGGIYGECNEPILRFCHDGDIWFYIELTIQLCTEYNMLLFLPFVLEYYANTSLYCQYFNYFDSTRTLPLDVAVIVCIQPDKN